MFNTPYGLYGMLHNYWVDRLLQAFLNQPMTLAGAMRRKNDNSPTDEFIRIVLDQFKHPYPPYNPQTSTVLKNDDCSSLNPTPDWMNEDFLRKLVETVRAEKVDYSIGGLLSEDETGFLADYMNSVSAGKLKSIAAFQKWQHKGLIISEKQNWPLLNTILDIGIGSYSYWSLEFPRRPWVMEMFTHSEIEKIVQSAPPWVHSDLKGAAAGAIGGAIGGPVGAGGGALGGAALASSIEVLYTPIRGAIDDIWDWWNS